MRLLKWTKQIVDDLLSGKYRLQNIDWYYRYKDSLDKFYEELDYPPPHIPYRMSSIALPWASQVLSHWYPPGRKDFNGQTQLRILEGYMFEAWMTEYMILRAAEFGYQVETQREVSTSVNGLKLVGHADLVVHSPTESLVIEFKALSTGTIKQLVDFDMMVARWDMYGYISQLSGYSNLLNIPGIFVIKDKDNSNILVVPMLHGEASGRWGDIWLNASTASTIRRGDIDKLIDELPYPPPRKEKKDGRITGRTFVPTNLQYDRWWPVFYKELGREGSKILVVPKERHEIKETIRLIVELYGTNRSIITE